MLALWFRMPPEVAVEAWRARLGAEIGPRRAGPRNVELSQRGDVLEILSMDAVAIAYAGKVSVALGGSACLPGSHAPRPYRPAAWTDRPWRELSRWRRLRIWLGPMRLHD